MKVYIWHLQSLFDVEYLLQVNERYVDTCNLSARRIYLQLSY